MRESPYGYWGLEKKNTCKTQLFTLQPLQLIPKVPLKKGAGNVCDPQNNSGKSHPAWAKFWSHCMDQFVFWVWLEAKGLHCPCGTSFLPWERRCSKSWASYSAGYLSLCVPVLWFKASLVFLQVYGTELIFTIWELKYWERLENANFQKPLLLLQLPVVPVSLKWPWRADTAWIFWEILSGEL